MKWNFQGWPRKNNVEFPGVFVFGLGISKGSNTILWNIQGLSFVLSGISRCKVKKWKIPGKFSKKYILNSPLVWIFSGIAPCIVLFSTPTLHFKEMLLDNLSSRKNIPQIAPCFDELYSIIKKKGQLKLPHVLMNFTAL